MKYHAKIVAIKIMLGILLFFCIPCMEVVPIAFPLLSFTSSTLTSALNQSRTNQTH